MALTARTRPCRSGGRVLAANKGKLGTRTMQEIGSEPGRIYSAEEVRRVRGEFPSEGKRFLLRGELTVEFWGNSAAEDEVEE